MGLWEEDWFSVTRDSGAWWVEGDDKSEGQGHCHMMCLCSDADTR